MWSIYVQILYVFGSSAAFPREYGKSQYNAVLSQGIFYFGFGVDRPGAGPTLAAHPRRSIPRALVAGLGTAQSEVIVWIRISSASFTSSVMKSRRTEPSCRTWSHFENRDVSARNSPFLKRMAAQQLISNQQVIGSSPIAGSAECQRLTCESHQRLFYCLATS